MRLRLPVVALCALALALPSTGCGRVRAKAAFKEGNRLYKEENFRKAIDEYKRAIELDSEMAEAYFYMGSSFQALYRPGKEGDENKARLDAAIDAYKTSLQKNTASSENLRKVKLSTLSALTTIYSEDPYKNFDEAYGYAQQLVQDNPTDARNLFAMAALYEKFERVAEAEQSYAKAFEVNPQDVKACNALAAFYNKPLWEGRSKFDESIATLDNCAALAPEDPSGYYRIAQFYWDKAYRDPLLDDAQKDAYAEKGLAEVDKALQLKPDHVDAIVYKGLLYRVKAQVSRNPRLRMQFLDQAQTLQKQALELKKEQQEQQQQQAAQASPAP